MRHTLLPLSERKTLRREYRIRALIVFCFTLSVAGLIGVAALFPSFVRTSLEQRANENAVAVLKKKKADSGLAAMEADISRSQAVLHLLQAAPVRSNLSDPIAAVVALRGPIKLVSFAVSQSTASTSVVVIQGSAPTRNDLLAFRSRLETLTGGAAVDLPISALARTADIQFSLRFTEILP